MTAEEMIATALLHAARTLLAEGGDGNASEEFHAVALKYIDRAIGRIREDAHRG